MGKEGFQDWNDEINQMSPEEQGDLLDSIVSESDQLDVSGFFPPELEEDRKASLAQWETLAEDEKQEGTQRAQFFWCFAFAQFYNSLSVMIHGERLTSLVSRAIDGDQGAFCKAIQIDRSILSHHPYFVRRPWRRWNAGRQISWQKLRIANRTQR
jgi:hypothetical protein